MANYIEEAGAVLGTACGRFVIFQGPDSLTALRILELVQTHSLHREEKE